LKPLDFTLNIRAPNQYLGTKTYQLNLFEQVLEGLVRYYASQSKSIAFPELAIPSIIQLRRIIKTCKDVAMTKQMQQLIEKVHLLSCGVVGANLQVY
jgi:nucleolar complex protein 2